MVRQILGVVAWCHLQGVVHRDLKPEVSAAFMGIDGPGSFNEKRAVCWIDQAVTFALYGYMIAVGTIVRSCKELGRSGGQ